MRRGEDPTCRLVVVRSENQAPYAPASSVGGKYGLLRMSHRRSRGSVAMMKLKLVSTCLAASVLVAASAAGAVKVPGAKFGKPAKASGEFAIAQASGTTRDPSKIFAKVTSKPRQQVSGAYSVVCSKGFGAGTKSGSIKGRTPLVRRLRLPMGNPDSCTAAANAQLQDGGGTVRVRLYRKR